MTDKQITLVVTNKCNLHCTYCYENHDERTMDLATAHRIIKSEISKAYGKTLEFDFFGGEPFLEFELIVSCFEYIKKLCEDHNTAFHCFATTNGTLVHGPIQRWLVENIDYFSCGLSIDGNKEMHDINRCASFNDIDLPFFAKNYSDQPVKMTISPQSLPHLFDGVKFLHENGFEVSNNLAYGIDWREEKNLDILREQLSLLIDYYLQNPQIKPCSLLDESIAPLAYAHSSSATEFEKHCGAGLNMVTYDADGIEYPCQMFMPLSVGNRAKKLGEISFPNKISIKLLNKECQTCIVNSLCSFCYGINYKERKSIFSHSSELCKYNKILIKARAYFKARQFFAKQLNADKNEEQAILRSIKIIQEQLII